MRLYLHAILAASCALGACSSLPAPDPPYSTASAACIDWFMRLDISIDAAGVRDAEAHRVPGYPHLRSNRLLASFADEAGRSSALYPDWLDAMRALDQDARDIEIRNLPSAAAQSLEVAGKDILREHIVRCGKVLRAENDRQRQAPPHLSAAALVPDNYSTARRALGIYPLFSIPFLDGVERWQRRTTIAFERQRMLQPDRASTIRHLPPAANLRAENPRSILARAGRNALGLPHFSETDRENLIAAFAPALEIDAHGDDDRFGAIAWQHGVDGYRPLVNPAQPTVYSRIAFARLGREVFTQLVYTIWFPRRSSTGAFDLLAGELDGVIFRITIDGEGRPLIADSIHACGCYHEFFPGPRMTPKPAPDPHLEWAFAPAPLPSAAAGARFSWRLATGTHYVTGLESTDSTEGIRYALADENRLRTLSISTDATRSLYGPDGLVASSKRGERFLFWPMGIDNAGAMRQWGGHATAFVGRRHFDDADLLDRRFTLTRD